MIELLLTKQKSKMAKYYNNILETIGNTPLVKLNKIVKDAFKPKPVEAPTKKGPKKFKKTKAKL